MGQNEKTHNFLYGKVSPEEDDETLNLWVKKIMDTELRDHMDQTLENIYNVKRKNEKGFVLRYLRPLLATAASIALLVSLFIGYQNNISPESLATEYIVAQTLKHPGSSKGISQPNLYRTDGIMAFNSGDYEKATLSFEKIELPNLEDSYYLGLAYLKTGNLANAIEELKKCTHESSRFKEEANWFLALALVLEGKNVAAQQQLYTISKDAWKYAEAQELLKRLKKINAN